MSSVSTVTNYDRFSVFCQVAGNYDAVRTFFPIHPSFGNVFALPCLCLVLPL